MTRTEMNDIIIAHVSAELRDAPTIGERIGVAFNKWFNNLVTTASAEAIQTKLQQQNSEENKEETAVEGE